MSTVPEDGLSVVELDAVDAVPTGYRVGIAATGTIVLEVNFAQRRRTLTLVLVHRVCIVPLDQVVNIVPQVFRHSTRLDHQYSSVGAAQPVLAN